jgi:ribosomal-protein-alanine N-acetyltransferase
MIAFLRRLFAPETALSDASARDARAISQLHAQSFHRGWSDDEIEQLLSDRAVMTHRATASGRLCGFIMSRVAADEAEILSVAVARANRGGGLAGKLLRLHLSRLAARGVTAVFLEVEENNQAAIRLYRRAGFAQAGRREGYYPGQSKAGPGAPSAALVLRRDID